METVFPSSIVSVYVMAGRRSASVRDGASASSARERAASSWPGGCDPRSRSGSSAACMEEVSSSLEKVGRKAPSIESAVPGSQLHHVGEAVPVRRHATAPPSADLQLEVTRKLLHRRMEEGEEPSRLEAAEVERVRRRLAGGLQRRHRESIGDGPSRPDEDEPPGLSDELSCLL